MSSILMLAAAAAGAASAAPEAPMAAAGPDMAEQIRAVISPVFLLLWAAALCAVSAVIHSVLGEMKLVRPLLAVQTGVMESPLARNVTRVAWHWMSVLWVLVGALLAAAAYDEVTAKWLLIAVGAAHVLGGLGDAAITRGRHIGWPLIILIGAFTLTSVYLTW